MFQLELQTPQCGVTLEEYLGIGEALEDTKGLFSGPANRRRLLLTGVTTQNARTGDFLHGNQRRARSIGYADINGNDSSITRTATAAPPL